MYANNLLDIAMSHSSELVEKAIAGNTESQSKLVKLWFKRIYNFSCKYLSDHDMAMEVSQKTFITFYEKAHQIKAAELFKPWLYKVATNYCKEELRKELVQTKYFSKQNAESFNKKAEEKRFNPEQELDHKDMNHTLQLAINSLPVDQKEIVIMKEYEGLKFREIAEVLKINENTVKSKLYYGLHHLRKYFKENNISKETLAL